LILVSDEINGWLALYGSSWSSNLEVGGSIEFSVQDVNESLLLVLFWENDFSLLAGRAGWGLYEDDVDVFVLTSWNSDNSGLFISRLIWSNMNVDVSEGLTSRDFSEVTSSITISVS
jgi:hypothetical protein